MSSSVIPDNSALHPHVHDRVALLDNTKAGVLRFMGPTAFKDGVWAGIEVDDIYDGKHDGVVGGVRYFHCAPGKGIFVPLDKIYVISPATPTRTGSPEVVHSAQSARNRASHGGSSTDIKVFSMTSTHSGRLTPQRRWSSGRWSLPSSMPR